MKRITTVEDINMFLAKFIDSYIISDIRKLININEKHQTSYPYLALAFSGIDFFGALEKGVKKKVGARFTWFISEWMGRITPLYRENYLADLIYDSCRNGILHNAVLKNSFNISSYLYPRSVHLHLLSESNLVFFHSIQFAEDFLKAQDRYRKHISQSNDNAYIQRLCTNLSDMIQMNSSENTNNTDQLILGLRLQGRVLLKDKYSQEFTTKTTLSTTTTSKPCTTTMTVPPTYEDES